MSPVAIVLSQRAKQEIDEARAWWAEHRGGTVLDDAIAKALQQIDRFPESGARVLQGSAWTTTRKIGAGRTGYQFYYVFHARAGTILVRCFWHERRRPPRL
jgi:plasmid stabilization system protein ParE